MAKYIGIYKCQMCESLIETKEFEMVENMETALVEKVIKNQQFIGSLLYDAPMFVSHSCSKWNAGVAQLVGFKSE